MRALLHAALVCSALMPACATEIAEGPSGSRPEPSTGSAGLAGAASGSGGMSGGMSGGSAGASAGSAGASGSVAAAGGGSGSVATAGSGGGAGNAGSTGGSAGGGQSGSGGSALGGGGGTGGTPSSGGSCSDATVWAPGQPASAPLHPGDEISFNGKLFTYAGSADLWSFNSSCPPETGAGYTREGWCSGDALYSFTLVGPCE